MKTPKNHIYDGPTQDKRYHSLPGCQPLSFVRSQCATHLEQTLVLSWLRIWYLPAGSIGYASDIYLTHT